MKMSYRSHFIEWRGPIAPVLEMTVTSPSGIYGALLSEFGLVDNYHGDHYHDAIWLSKQWESLANDSQPFWYVRRKAGTHIGKSKTDVIDATLLAFEDVVHAVEVRILPANYQGQWRLEIWRYA